MDTNKDSIDNGQVMGVGFGEQEEEEEGEEPSFLSVTDQLEQFRQQWREELYMRKRSNSYSDQADIEAQARQCFMTGSRLEQEGSLYQAIQFYRHAMRLVPDIENLIQVDFLGHSPRERQTSESSVDSYDGEVLDSDVDLATRFQDLQLEETGWCMKEYQQRACHVSALPSEVIIYILKWVVSTQLDMRSLENVAMVCRGFYLFARDAELWRLACNRIWGSNTGKVKKYGSWRNMYIERPHLQFTGCYISKMTYSRRGERTLEQHYDPWYTVHYFRYIRFFSDGQVLMMTSGDEPEVTLSKLKNANTELIGVQKGVYRLSGNTVTAVLKRKSRADTTTMPRYKRNKNQVNSNKTSQTFHMDLEIGNAGKRKGHKLTWLNYNIQTLCKVTGEETVSEFKLTNQTFPPLIFSRVKSYSASADSPLTM